MKERELLLVLVCHLVLLSSSFVQVQAVRSSSDSCHHDLGMDIGHSEENGYERIPDSSLTASSSHNEKLGPKYARIHGSGAWCPKGKTGPDSNEYIQIDLGVVRKIIRFATQGRFASGQGNEYMAHYKVEYQRNEQLGWIKYHNHSGYETLQGNTNSRTTVYAALNPPIIARRIRIIPVSEKPVKVCMRIGITGCQWKAGIISYSIPQGDTFGPLINLTDNVYDGQNKNGMLVNGLGQLVDSDAISEKNTFREMHYGKYGYRSVGWRKSESRSFVPLIFEFDQVRNFSKVFINVANSPDDNITWFSEARVYFSKGAKYYQPTPVTKNFEENLSKMYLTVTKAKKTLPILIDLKGRLGKLVKIELDFKLSFILIYEVIFYSVPFDGNYTLESPPPTTSAEPGSQDGPTTALGSNGTGHRQPQPGPLDHIVVVAIIGVLAAALFVFIIICFIFTLRYRRRKATKNNIDSKESSFGSPISINYTNDIRTPLNGIGPKPIEGGNFYTSVSSIEHFATSNSLDKRMLGQNNLSSPGDDNPDIHQYQTRIRDDYAPDLTQSTSGLMVTMSSPQSHSPQSGVTTDLYSPAVVTTTMTMGSPTTPGGPITYPNQNNSLYHNGAPYNIHHHNNGGVGGGGDLYEYDPPVPVSSPLLNGGADTTPAPGNSYKQPPRQTPFSPYLRSIELAVADSPKPRTSNTLPALQMSNIQGVLGNSVVQLLRNTNWSNQQPLKEQNRRCLTWVATIGRTACGQIQICEMEGSRGEPSKTVAVKVLNERADQITRSSFLQETKLLAQLKDANVAQLVGVCMREEPFAVIVQYTDCDLYQYLGDHASESISLGVLVHMASQVTSGMKYLESMGVAHRDLACRNCLIDPPRHRIKISDLAAAKPEYRGQYSDLYGGRLLLPIRWMAWETLALNQFTSRSDVWSFGVLLWEMFTRCHELPLLHLSDNDIVNLGREALQTETTEPLTLPHPFGCPKEYYDLMCECWKYNELERPPFREIHMFLQRKNIGFTPLQ